MLRAAVIAFSLAPTAALAQVVTDGSLGPAVSLSGPHFQVTQDLGARVGPNLFHSFQTLRLNAGQSATFSGDAGIRNVISRVTGGQASLIDGRLASSIQGANFFLMNPSGVIFGPGAQIDVSGSFAVTTADRLRLADGGVFAADLADQTTLTSAPPAAFGFLAANPAAIEVAGDPEQPTTLRVPAGRTLGVVGGPVRLVGGRLEAPNGRVALLAVGGPGEVAFDPDQIGSIDVTGPLAAVDLQDSALAVDGPSGGGVVVIADTFTAADTALSARSTQRDGGRGVQIVTNGDVTLQRTQIRVDAAGPDHPDGGVPAGQSAGDIVMRVGGNLSATDGSLVSSSSNGAGNAGNILVEAGDLLLDGGAGGFAAIGAVTSAPQDAGAAGSIRIDLRGDAILRNNAAITSLSEGQGDAGRISITARSLLMDRGGGTAAAISADTQGARGAGGDISVQIEEDLILRNGAVITSTVLGQDDAGDISLNAGDIVMESGSIVSTLTSGPGAGGDITLFAFRELAMSGNAIVSATSAQADAGPGGDISIDAGDVSVTDRASITTGTLGQNRGGLLSIVVVDTLLIDNGLLGADTSGAGRGGGIDITAARVGLRNDARISATTEQGGQGGDIRINASELLSVGASQIAADTTGSGAGGTVALISDGLVEVFDDASVSSSTAGSGVGGLLLVQADNLLVSNAVLRARADESATADSGSISLDVRLLEVFDGGIITTNTDGTGGAGPINIAADDVRLGDGSSIRSDTTNAQGGPGGDITIITRLFEKRGESFVSTTTIGGGRGGTLALVATERATLQAGGGIGAVTNSDLPARAGNVIIDTPLLEVPGGSISVASLGAGDGGFIDISAGDVLLSQGGTIASASLGGGNAGGISIFASGDLRLTDNSTISTAAQSGNGGDMVLRAGRSLLVRDSLVEAQAAGNGGNIALLAPYQVRIIDSEITAEAGLDGGQIIIDPVYVILQNSVIDGRAGGQDVLVRINADVFLSGNSRILTSTAILPPTLDISGSLTTLRTALLDADTSLRELCPTDDQDASSLIVTGSGGTPPTASGWLSSPAP